MERSRDELDHECNELHSKHGDALNEIELLKEQIANQKSEPAAGQPLELPDEFTFAEQVNKKYPKLKVKVTGQQVRKIWEFMGLS